ncbi:MAG: Bax inhibitor-1 family protein [Gemmataceae bacterium]
MSFALDFPVAAEAGVDERSAFVRRAYGHFAAALLVFGVIELVLFQLDLARPMTEGMFAGGRLVMIGIIVAFMAVGTLARWWAHHSASLAMQYLGLALYVFAQALICVPMLTLAVYFTGDRTILPKAGVMAGAVMVGLTAAAFSIRPERLHRGPLAALATALCIGAGLAGYWYGFNLALGVCVLFVVLASGYVVYDVSTIVHQYRTDQHVGAALKLFADVALLFLLLIYLLWSVSNQE